MFFGQQFCRNHESLRAKNNETPLVRPEIVIFIRFYSPLKLEVCQIKMTLYFHMDPPVCEDTSCLIARLFGRVNERCGGSNLLYLPVFVL